MWLLRTHVARRLHKLDRERKRGRKGGIMEKIPAGDTWGEEEILALQSHMRMFTGSYQIQGWMFYSKTDRGMDRDERLRY